MIVYIQVRLPACMTKAVGFWKKCGYLTIDKPGQQNYLTKSLTSGRATRRR